MGNIWGGSSTLVSWTPPEKTIFSDVLSSANFGKQNMSYYSDFKPQNVNVGFSAQEIAAEINSKQLTFKIPIVGNKVTIGGSASLGVGASGHLTSSQKDGVSAGLNFGLGFGGGISLKIK